MDEISSAMAGSMQLQALEIRAGVDLVDFMCVAGQSSAQGPSCMAPKLWSPSEHAIFKIFCSIATHLGRHQRTSLNPLRKQMSGIDYRISLVLKKVYFVHMVFEAWLIRGKRARSKRSMIPDLLTHLKDFSTLQKSLT